MKIFNSAGIEILDIEVTDSSYLYKAIQEIGSLTLYFSSTAFIEIPLLSYCQFQGETFYLTDPGNFKKHGTRNFEYTLVLENIFSNAKRYKIRNIVDGRLKFSLTAKPQDHLQLIVDNMNLRGEGWVVGNYIDASEKVLNYSHIYALDALKMIAEEFNTEWEVEGKTIHLKKVEYNKDTPLALSYGKGNGFRPGVGRMNLNDSRPVELLYVQGGERNIDFSKYNSKELLLPKNQQLVYNGRTYQSDADGVYIKRADKAVQFHNEDSLDLSHIYPSRVGTISSVVVVDADKHFYDIIDSSIPDALNYNDCRIAGEKATIVFQSGMLAGREFDIEQTDDALTGYVHAERRFKLVPQEIDGVIMPNATFIPAVSDKYAVFNISLPDAYICDNVSQQGSSWDMFREAAKYLNENEDQKFSFTGELDGIWAKQNWINVGGKIKPGGYVSFSDTQFQAEGVLVRMTSVKQLVNNPYSPVVELSNAPAGGSIGTTLKKIDANEVLVDRLNKEAIRYAKRGFRDSKQTAELLANAMKYYSEAISPVAVQTMSLLLGDESLQFRFVDDMLTPVTVSHNVQYNSATKVLNSPAGIIQHMTLGIDSISSSRTASQYKFWNVPVFNSPALVEVEKSYYLYAKVSKSSQMGNFLLSETPIGMEDVADYYHLLVGILNTENDEGDRTYVDFYGYTELTPGRITTNKIVSPGGKIVIDLESDTCELQGSFKFSSGVGVEESVSQVNEKVDGIKIGGRNLILNSADWTKLNVQGARGVTIYKETLDGYSVLRVECDNSNSDPFLRLMNIIKEQCLQTFSVEAKRISGECQIRFFINDSSPLIVATLTDKWERFSVSQDVTVANSTYNFVNMYPVVGTVMSFYLRLPKLERGNRATDWTPAPEEVDAEIAENKTYVETVKNELQTQIDGQILSWFHEYDPLTTNSPASDWTSDILKQQHANDTFTNTLTGGCWRWQQVGGVWQWGVITDTATQKALANAAKAQDTADGKRRVFSSQPVPPYDVNDLWVQGGSGDFLKCNAPKAAGQQFSAIDWEKASKYTDDTFANNIQVGGRNIIPINPNIDHWSLGGSGVSGSYTKNYSDGFFHTKAIRFQTTGSYQFRISFPIIRKANYYALSFYYKCFLPINYSTTQINDTSLNNAITESELNVWKYYSGYVYVNNYIGQYGFIDLEFGERVDFLISDMKLEIGNKPTDWTPAPEDVDAKIQASAYLTEAIKNDTNVAGGLLSTTLMKVGAVNSAGTWVEKAGINGAGSGDDTPRFYSGGTLQKAIQRIAGDIVNGAKTVITEGGKIYGREVELFGSMATAPSGERIVLDQASKSIIIYDLNNVPKSVITSQAIPSLASLLAGNSQSVNAAVSVAVSSTNGVEVSDTKYSAVLTLPATSSNYKLITPAIACSCDVTTLDSLAISEVSAYLVMPDNTKVQLGAISANVSGLDGDTYNEQTLTIPSREFNSMPAGDYKIEINGYAITEIGHGNQANASIDITGNLTGESLVSVSRIFRDGIFLISDASNYTYISPSVFEDCRGGTTVRHTSTEKSFGVLAAADVTANNVLTAMFGGILGTPTNNGTGLYTIPHSLGHTNYRVIVSARGAGNYTATVVAENSNNCQVQLKNGGTNANLPFNIMLVG